MLFLIILAQTDFAEAMSYTSRILPSQIGTKQQKAQKSSVAVSAYEIQENLSNETISKEGTKWISLREKETPSENDCRDAVKDFQELW